MRMSMLFCARCLVLAGLAFLTGLCASGTAKAQTCGTDYNVKEGESLGDIAARVYGNSSQWTLIFYANQDRMGANASMLVPGLAIRIPCVGGQQPAAAAPAVAAAPAPSPVAPQANGIELSHEVKRIEFLTADGYTPFTDRSLPGGGMVAQLMSSSMDLIKEQSSGKFGYSISWVNDWGSPPQSSAHNPGFRCRLPLAQAGLQPARGSFCRCEIPLPEVFLLGPAL